jgi:hydroxyacylglutathione hydrolase
MTSREDNQLNRESLKINRPECDKSYIVISIPMGNSNSYLIVSAGRGVLVDAGCPGKIKNIQTALEQNNLIFQNIVLVILTHTHYDHTGCLAEIKKRSGAKVLVHASEKGCLEKGITPFPRGTVWFSKMISGIGNSLMASKSKYQPVNPDLVVGSEYDLGTYLPGAKVISTPGHTTGSISLVIGNEAAFVGDTLFNVMPWSVFPPFANDIPELLKSWQRLIDTGCRTFFPGHGKPITLQKLKVSYEKRSKISKEEL